MIRIEDTDEARNRPEWTEGIIDSLGWIGISADDPHFEGPRFQSEDADAHLVAAQRLFESGHAYYCDLTQEALRAEVEKTGGPTVYDGRSRDRGLGPACRDDDEASFELGRQSADRFEAGRQRSARDFRRVSDGRSS